MTRPPAPVKLSVPPVAKVTVTGELAEVPTVHVEVDGNVIASVIVQVSPGVVKLVGATDPSVQLVRLFIGPAALVVHAVVKPLNPILQNNIVKKNVLIAVAFKLLNNKKEFREKYVVKKFMRTKFKNLLMAGIIKCIKC